MTEKGKAEEDEAVEDMLAGGLVYLTQQTGMCVRHS